MADFSEMLSLQLLLMMASSLGIVRCDFIVTVNFIDYTNPTGLCAECQTKLGLNGITSADQLVPVCCDQTSPVSMSNCVNTGEERCDTRFRWTLRPFGSSLVTRPRTMANADFPPYLFTDCGLSTSTCPFSEMSTTFGEGELGFLGVAENPLPVPSRALTTWTGSVQFFIESIESEVPNVIDSILVNLDNLQLGAGFTDERTYTGFSNISQMTMSFRVECAPGYCGPDCTVNGTTVDQIADCLPNGSMVCVDGWDPSTNCTTCTSDRRVDGNCGQCVNNTDPLTDCLFCPSGLTGEQCMQADIAGPVVGVLAALLLVVLVVTVVIIAVVLYRRSQGPTAKAGVSAVNTTVQEAPGDNDYVTPATLERDLQNPLYDTAAGEDYSAPWENSEHYAIVKTTSSASNKEHPADSRARESAKAVENGYSEPQRPVPGSERTFDNTGEHGLYGGND